MALRTRQSGWDLGPEERVSSASRPAAQIRVVARQPVLPRRIEDVDVERVLQRLGGVRQVRRNGQHLARTDVHLLRALLAEAEAKRPVEDVGDLLVLVLVAG